jgi:hypothetical protein
MTDSFFKNFPKQRITLPDAYKTIYEQEYIINRTGTSVLNKVALWLEGWMHRKVAEFSTPMENVLELGAGSLNHLKYEINFKNYDVVEPFKELLKESKQSDRVRSIFSDITEIKRTQKYD